MLEVGEASFIFNVSIMEKMQYYLRIFRGGNCFPVFGNVLVNSVLIEIHFLLMKKMIYLYFHFQDLKPQPIQKHKAKHRQSKLKVLMNVS